MDWRIAIIGLALVAVAPAAHAGGFLRAIEDVPLVAGLAEEAEPVVFESDQGRVVRTRATGQVDGPAVTAFYAATLPSLGWRRLEAAPGLVFERENERLAIAIGAPAPASPLEVRFELIVTLASTRLPE